MLDDFDADSAGAEGFVDAGEPELVLPNEAQFGADVAERFAVVRAAIPEAARPRAAKVVFAREQQHPPSGLHDASEFRQPIASVGQMLEHIAAGDAIEGGVGKWQPRDIGDEKGRAIALDPRP